MTNTLEKVYLLVIRMGVFVLFFIPLLIAKNYFFPYIFGKAIVLRIIIEVIALIYILLVFLNKKYMPKRSYLFWGVVIYMGIKGITTLTGVNPYHSFWSNYERMEGFLTLIHFGILFVVMSGVFRTKEDWKLVFKVSLLGSFIVALYGIGQKLDLDFIMHAGIDKIDSTIGNSSYVAAYLLYSVFIALYLLFRDRNVGWRVFYGISLVLNLVVIGLTTSRGGISGLLIGLLVFAILFLIGILCGWYKFGSERKKKVLIFVLVLYIAGNFLGGGALFSNKNAGWVKGNYILNKMASISLDHPTIQDRIINARIGFAGFGERFFLGYGMENYYVPFNKYYNSRTSEPWFDRAHNILLDNAITSGIFGLLSYLFLIGFSIIFLLKVLKRNLVVGFTFIPLLISTFWANLFVFDNSSTYTMFFTVLVFISFLAFGKNGEEEDRRGSTSIFVPIALIVLLGLSVYFFNIRPAIANRTSIEGYKYSQANYDRSEEYFKEAVAYNTFGNPEIALRIGDIAVNKIEGEDENAKRAMAFAVEVLEDAMEKEPDNARYYIYIGGLYGSYFNKIDGSEENYRKALWYLEKALELSPDRQGTYYALGRVMLSVNKYEEAIDYFKKAVEIKVDRTSLYNLWLAYVYGGEEYSDKAEETFARIDEGGYFEGYTPGIINNMFNIYYGRDDFSKTIKILSFYTDRYSHDPDWYARLADYHGKLAEVHRIIGEKDKAREHALKVKEFDPEQDERVDDFLEDLNN